MRLERRQHGPGFRRAAELQQRQRPLQLPVPAGARIVLQGRRRRVVEQGERLGTALLEQHVGRKVQPGAGIAWIVLQRRAQQGLGGRGMPRDPQEGAKIGRSGEMSRLVVKSLAHGGLGVVESALAIAGDAVTHPGVGPGRSPLERRREGLLGASRFVQREPGLTVDVMGIGALRRGMTGFAGGMESRPGLALRQQRDSGHKLSRRALRSSC